MIYYCIFEINPTIIGLINKLNRNLRLSLL
ncbi:Uncharacterised protein [Legionella pneumophila]|nr:Uncharacterised protein [Legionella pneumophila]CZG01700.1 Uncharacterised protein [Legionella pneumophila]CZG03585.1 Uncharacterised protein [Legionella pneumophila]CZG04256.1 Uncharacterised protein [Legionella pneumophila]CZG04563.1 Uncharacterised protein [Legionella pneumophila]